MDLVLDVLAQVTTTPVPGGPGAGSAAGGGSGLLLWGIVLLGVALALFIVEMFVPSGGLIGFLSAASLVTGVVFLFRVDTTLGLLSALAALVAVPILLGLMLKVAPHTWIAQLLTLKDDESITTAPPPIADTPVRVGQRGKALTDLRPVGTCLIDGRRVDCVAHGGMLTRGTEVEVVAVEGLEVRVRAA